MKAFGNWRARFKVEPEAPARKLLPLAWLAPDLATAIMDGGQPKTFTLGALVKRSIPMDWDEQRALFASFQ